MDIRSEIHQIVSAIIPLDALEQDHIRFVLDWIESGREIFRTEKPAIPDTHLVSYFVIASPEMDRVLLVDHKKAELWLPPGGHVDQVKKRCKEKMITRVLSVLFLFFLHLSSLHGVI